MRIRRLQVRDLRRYRELDIDLAPGVTVVRGPNEAGKSTIQRAIELALTRRVTSTAADLESLRPWDASAETRPWVAIEFEQDEEDGRLATGSVEKLFGGQKGTVDLEYDGQRVNDPALADQVLAELSGIPTESFFRSTASVRHHELSDLARDETALRDRLQASISGADRGTGRAKKRLERAIFELTTKGDKNPGRLKVAEATVAQTAASVEKGEASLGQLERDRDALSGARERRVEADRMLAEKRAMLEKARQAERLDAERTAARERYERFREAVEVSTELDELAQTHPSPNPLPVIRQAVERLRVLDTRMRELNAALAGEIDVNFEVAPEPTWRPTVALGPRGGRRRAGHRGWRLPARSPEHPRPRHGPAVLGVAIALIGVILTAVALWLRRGSRAMQSSCATSRSTGDCGAGPRWRPSFVRPRRTRTSSSATLGLDDLAAAEDLLGREEAHVARMDQLSAQLDGLVGKEPRETLPKLARHGAPSRSSRRRAPSRASGRSPRSRERASASRSRCATRRARSIALGTMRPTLAPVSRTTPSTPSRSRPRPSISPCGASSWPSSSAVTASSTRRCRADRARRDRDDEDRDALPRGSHEPRRLDGHGRPLSARPGRRQDASTSISTPRSAATGCRSATLSQGTLDLVYLTARLGLVRLVTGDRRPPLVFDDPFVTLDDERATRALALLKRVADDFQIIYLTTSDRYDGAAHAVVELPGPATVDEGVEDPALRPVETATGASA